MPRAAVHSYRYVLIATSFLLSATALGEGFDVERAGLIYGIGHIEQVNNGTAIIDMGDAHVLRIHDRVAVIRDVGGYYTPVGVLTIAETFPTVSRTVRSNTVKTQAGDIVMFVREFSQLKTGPQYLDEYLSRQIIANSASNRYTTRRNLDTAMALLSYRKQHKEWERSSSAVIGYIEGASFANGERETIEDLLNHIAMIRELYQIGRNSLPAAGRKWAEVLPLLFGPTIIAQHEAAQAVTTEDDEFVDDDKAGPREVRQAVQKRMFDRLEEERNVVSFLIASIIEQSPRRVGLWFREKLRRSQFPYLAEEETMQEHLTTILVELRGEE